MVIQGKFQKQKGKAQLTQLGREMRAKTVASVAVVKRELAEAQAVMHARGDRVDEQATEISALNEAAVTTGACTINRPLINMHD